jgi:hypothetical protein
VIKVKYALNFLPLAVLAAKDKSLSNSERKDGDKKACSSEDNETSASRKTVRTQPKCRKYDLNYLHLDL